MNWPGQKRVDPGRREEELALPNGARAAAAWRGDGGWQAAQQSKTDQQMALRSR